GDRLLHLPDRAVPAAGQPGGGERSLLVQPAQAAMHRADADLDQAGAEPGQVQVEAAVVQDGVLGHRAARVGRRARLALRAGGGRVQRLLERARPALVQVPGADALAPLAQPHGEPAAQLEGEVFRRVDEQARLAEAPRDACAPRASGSRSFRAPSRTSASAVAPSPPAGAVLLSKHCTRTVTTSLISTLIPGRHASLDTWSPCTEVDHPIRCREAL